MTKKILILGGSGFVGFHLTETLAKKHDVNVLSRSHGKRTLQENVTYMTGDFVSEELMDHYLEEVDLVIHLISASVPASSQEKELVEIERNLMPSIQLLRAMQRKKVPRLLFLSSGGAVYGNQPIQPIHESIPLAPVSAYGIVKATIEHFITLYSRQFGIDSLILRASNLYGPNQSHSGVNGVINTMMDRLMNEDPIEIWGDGTQEKDYLYISDLVRAIELGIELELTGTFNVGSGTGTSLKTIITNLSDVAGRSIDPVFQSAKPFDVQRFILDSTQFRNKTGWYPTVSLSEGIKKLWDHKNKS